MILGGLWHGVGWTFLAWGLLHGGALSAERLWTTWRGKTKPNSWTHGLAIFCTFQFVCVTWIFFRAPDIPTAWSVLTRIFSGSFGVSNINLVMVAWFAVAVAAQFIPSNWFPKAVERFGQTPFVLQGATLAAVILVIEFMAGKGSSSFVYSNF